MNADRWARRKGGVAPVTAKVRFTPVFGGLLVGGAGRRMGGPKQLLEVEGASMAERVNSALALHVDEVMLLGAGEVPKELAARRLDDVPGVDGPLAGILAAVRWAPRAAWVIAACDLPRIEGRAVRWLLDQRRPGRWAVLPRLESGVEPLLAIYEPQACELLEDLVAAGELAPHRLAECAAVATPTPPEALRCCWFNANTPRDLRAVMGGGRRSGGR